LIVPVVTIKMVTVYELVFTETAMRQHQGLNPRLRKQVDRALKRIASNPRTGNR